MGPEQVEKEELTQIRYKPRAKDEIWIREYLGRVQFGMVGTAWEDQPFVTPTLFVYDQSANAIYFHSAAKGRLLDNIKANPKVCFTAGEMGRLLPAETAKEFDVEYSSVMVFGEAYWVEDPFEAQMGLELLLARYAPHLKAGQDYRGITQNELKVTAVYRLDIQAWSGKENLEAPDFPGAFTFGEGTGG